MVNLDCLCTGESHSMDCPWLDVFAAWNETIEEDLVTTNTQIPKGGPWCDHVLDPCELKDGTVVYASGTAYGAQHGRAFEPDYGCYLDGSWKPRCIAFHIGWTDYGLPLPTADDVITIGRVLLEQARSGKRVEVGCIGAHGRTGTMLAVLDVLAGESDYRAAIRHIRATHCHDAVENDEQEWYVGLIASIVYDLPTPPRVTPKPTVKVTVGKQTTKQAKGKGKRGSKR